MSGRAGGGRGDGGGEGLMSADEALAWQLQDKLFLQVLFLGGAFCPSLQVWVEARGRVSADEAAARQLLDILYILSHNLVIYSSLPARLRTAELYMCPHTTIYVSSYYSICVLILHAKD